MASWLVGSARPGNIYLDPLGGVDFEGTTIDPIDLLVESFAISSTRSECGGAKDRF